MKTGTLLLASLLLPALSVSSPPHSYQLPIDTPENAASIVAVGRVDRVYDSTLFRIRDVAAVPAPHTLLVATRNPAVDIRPGALVSVTGPVLRFSPEALASASDWKPTPALLDEMRGMPLLLASAVVGAGEALLAPLAEPHAVKVRPTLLSASPGSMAGMHVWVEQSRIAEVVSPRAFILEERDPGPLKVGGGRLLMITAVAAPDLRAGIPVEVIGTVYTLAGARALPAWPADVSAEAVNAFARGPVVVADVVRTPGGVMLYGGGR